MINLAAISNQGSNGTLKLAVAVTAFIALLTILFFIYRWLFVFLKRRAARTLNQYDDFLLDLLKIPALWLIYWVLLKIFSAIFLSDLACFHYLSHVSTLLLIAAITWMAIQLIKGGAYYLQSKLDIATADNLHARKNLTQIKIFKGIANSIILIIAMAVSLLTFEQAKTIGISLLTSAGIVGIIIGFAAQKTVGMVLAGIQLAITQPIRLDDVVIVEGEWGRIEEITLTYVIVKIWDERRLILPVTWFLEKPFQNWTRTNANIIGTVFLYVDYSFPVERLRGALPAMLQENSDWDGRVMNVQVTKTTEQYKEIRILLSSTDASKNWNLRTAMREKLIDFINANYPDAFAKLRIKTQTSAVA